VLALLYGNSDKAKELISGRKYCGDKIAAEEILPLLEEREKRAREKP